MSKHFTPRANPTMAALYLLMMEEAKAVADGLRRLVEECLGFAGTVAAAVAFARRRNGRSRADGTGVANADAKRVPGVGAAGLGGRGFH